jgi:hypothetical protein
MGRLQLSVSTARLKALGIRVANANDVDEAHPVYIRHGADEATTAAT